MSKLKTEKVLMSAIALINKKGPGPLLSEPTNVNIVDANPM